VSLYLEHGNQTFHSVHVEAAERLARHSREAGVARLVHVSGIGADPASPSPYMRLCTSAATSLPRSCSITIRP
jgi:uncharacterized protein YbjT (DUF2867 family)